MTANPETRARRRGLGIDLRDGVPRCSRCDLPNDRAPQRYCRACHAGYQRAWRAARVYVSRATSVSCVKQEKVA